MESRGWFAVWGPHALPSPLHVSAPVSSFASCSVCGFSVRGRGEMRGRGWGCLTAGACTDAGSRQGLRGCSSWHRAARAGTGLELLERFALVWGRSDRAEALGRTRLCAHGAKRRRAEVTPVPAGTSRGDEGPMPRIARPTKRRGCPAASACTSALSAASHERDPGPKPRPLRLAPVAGRTDGRGSRWPCCLLGPAQQPRR